MYSPDNLEAFPYVIYHASVGSKKPRGEHKKLDGKIFDKNDPWLRSHWPPSEFGCNCELENCSAKKAGKHPELVQPVSPPETATQYDSKSGYAFDPAHAFEKFDLSGIKTPELRERVAEKMSKEYEMSIGDNFKKLFWKPQEPKEEPVHFEARGMEEAQKQTQKLLPGATVDLMGIQNPEAVNKVNQSIDFVKQECKLDELNAILVNPDLPAGKPAIFNPGSGVLELNPAHINRTDQWKDPQTGNELKTDGHGAYVELHSNIYKGKETESIALHELYHAAAQEMVKREDGERRYSILLEAYNRASKEGFSISKHGLVDEYEFLSEIKTGKILANRKYPDYIEAMLKEFFS